MKISVSNGHPRSQEFTGTDSNGAEFSLQAIMFKDDTKLRSHAVKHFTSMSELNDWEKLKRIQPDRIMHCVDSLRELGCPHLVAKTINPPCWSADRRCRLFKSCGQCVGLLEETFLEMCHLVIQHGLNVPRDVKYKDADQGKYWWLLPDVPIVAKLAGTTDGTYNLMTCFRPLAEISAPWRQVLTHIVKSVRVQSADTPQWNTDETWGLQPPSAELDRKLHGKKRSKENPDGRKKTKPYQRGRDDWRRYLERMD